MSFQLFTCLRTLRTILGTSLHPVCNALCIESSADDVITHTGKVLNTAAADEHHAVLLQVVALAGDIRSNFDTVRQTDTGDLTKSRVRFLRGRGLNRSANAALLGRILIGRNAFFGVPALEQRRSLRFLLEFFSALTD